MGSVVADLVVNLIGNDAALLAATRRSTAALEDLAVQSVKVRAKITKDMTDEEKAQAESDARRQATMKSATASIQKYGKESALALGAIAAYSIDEAAKFQAKMELVRTQAGATGENLKWLSNQVLNLATVSGIGPLQLADGLYHIESAGFRGTDAINILTAAAKNSAIGLGDMESSSQAMVGTMAVAFKDVRDAADAAAFLNTTVGIGDMRMDQLSSAIATGVLPTFKEAGLGMTDFSAAIATLTDNVTPANQAATRLRMSIALLGAPSKAAFGALTAVGLGADEANKALANRAYLEKYGISISKLSTDLQKPDGLLVAVQDLKSHLAGLSQAEQAAVIEKAFGGGRTSAAIQTLLSESDRLKTKYDALGTSASRAASYQTAWADTQKTFRQQAHELGASLQTMAIQLGDKLLPPLTKFVEYLNSHKAAMISFFTVLLIFLGLMTTAFIAMAAAALANPVVWIVIAIVAAIALLAIGIYELVKHWNTVWKFIKRIAEDVWRWLVDAWNATWRTIMAVVHWIESNIINPIVALIKRLVKAFQDDWHTLLAVVAWIQNNIFKPIADFAWNWMLLPLRLVMDLIIFAFKFAWGFVSGVIKETWNGTIHPVVNFIVDLFKKFIDQQRQVWDTFVNILKDAWKFMVSVRNGIMNDFVNPLVYLIQNYLLGALRGAWKLITDDLKDLGHWFSFIWDGIKGAVQNAWDLIRPIFKMIQDAFHGIQDALNNLNPGKLGGEVAKLFHFAEGGVVPGPIGAPMLAVVHGGEVVLPNTVTSDMRTGSSVAMATSSAGSVVANMAASGAMGGGGPMQVNVYLDGKPFFDFMVTRAQRNKIRTTSTYLQ